MFKFLKKVLRVLRDAVVIILKVALAFGRVFGLAVGVISVAALTLGFALYSTGYFHSLTRFAIEKYMSAYTRTECRVGRVEGSLLTGLDIYDLRVGDGPSLEEDGLALRIDEIHVRYDPMRFIRRDATLERIHCVRPWLVLRKDADGRINLDRIFGPKGPPRGKGVFFVIEDVFLEDAYFKMELNSPLTEFSRADIRCTFTKARGAVFIDLRRCSCYLPEFGQRVPHFGSGSLAINSRLMHFNGVDVVSRNTGLTTNGTIKFEPDTYLDLRFQADPFDIGEVGQGVFDDPPEFFGRGRYAGSLVGPPEALSQSGRFTVDDGYLYGFDLRKVFVYYDFDIPARQIRIHGFEGRMNNTPTRVEMTLDFTGERPVYWGEARLLRMNLAEYIDSPFLTTDVDTHLRFSGAGLTEGEYVVDATAYFGSGQLGPILIDGGNADFVYTGTRAEVSGLSLRAGGGDLRVRGSGDSDALDFEVEARDIPFGRFKTSGELSRVGGLVSFEGRIVGPHARPSFEGGVVFKDFSYQGITCDLARVEGYWSDFGGDERAEIRLMAWGARWGFFHLARAYGDLDLENGLYLLRNGFWETADGDTARFDLGYDTRFDRFELSRLEFEVGAREARLTEPVVVERRDGRYEVSGGVLEYEGGEVALTGTYGPRDGALNLVAEARGVPLEEIIPRATGASVGGNLDRIRLDITGTTEAPVLYANLAASNLVVNNQSIDYIHGEASYEDGTVVIPGLVAGLAGGTLRASAYLPLTALAGEGEDPLDVTLWFSRFRLSALTSLYAPDLAEEGYLDGVITASGTAASPTVRGNFLLSEARWSGVRFAKGRADFTYRDGVMEIRELSLAETTLPNVVVTGRLPLNLAAGGSSGAGGRINLTVDFTDLDLRAMNPLSDEVLITGGKVRGRLELGGTYEKPRWEGRVEVVGGAGTVRALRSSFSDMDGALVARGDQITAAPAEPLSFRLDEGRGRVWGGVTFEGFKPTELDLTVDLEDYVIRAVAGVQALGDIRATIAGPIGQLRAVAEVTLSSGLITMGFGETSTPGEEAAPGGFEYEVRVVAPGNLWLRNKDAEIEFEADVTFRKTGGVTVYTGGLHARRGYYYFLKRDFAVETADVTFTGTEEMDPLIKIRAKREIRAIRPGNVDAVVYVDVTGTLREPELALRYEVVSGPTPGLTQEEITRCLALDVTWADLEALSSSELASKGSSDYVRRYAEAEVARAVRRQTGVDVFEFDANVFTGTEENPYAEVTVGQHLTRDIFVSYTGKYREYSSGSRELEHAAEVDYELKRDFYVVGSTFEDDGSQRYGLGLRFIHKY